MFDVSPVSFAVEIEGDVTGHRYEGMFKTKPILTHSEQLARDIIMRDLLGPNPKDGSIRAVSQAGIIAEIRIRCVETPSWWKDNGNGLGLYDENVIATVYDKIQEIDTKWKAEVKAKADKAKADLKDLAAK